MLNNSNIKKIKKYYFIYYIYMFLVNKKKYQKVDDQRKR